jgi:hypothetical protein
MPSLKITLEAAQGPIGACARSPRYANRCSSSLPERPFGKEASAFFQDLKDPLVVERSPPRFPVGRHHDNGSGRVGCANSILAAFGMTLPRNAHSANSADRFQRDRLNPAGGPSRPGVEGR